MVNMVKASKKHIQILTNDEDGWQQDNQNKNSYDHRNH